MESFRSLNTRKLGRYLTSNKQTSLNFDSFIFSDNITNSRIVIKDAKDCFSTIHNSGFHKSTTKSTKNIDIYA